MKKSNLIKTIGIAATVVSLLAFTGCATMFGNNNRIVHVASNEKGATVYLNNNRLGKTPIDVTIPSMYGANLVTVKKAGFEDSTQNVMTSFQPVSFLDILFWPSIIVDGVTGNFMKIDSTNMQFTLSKK